MNWQPLDDVTMTVDPQRYKIWIINNGRSEKEWLLNEERDFRNNLADVERLQGWQGNPSAYFASLDPWQETHEFGYTARPDRCWKGRKALYTNVEQLPSITNHLYTERESKSMGQIETEIREAIRRRDVPNF